MSTSRFSFKTLSIAASMLCAALAAHAQQYKVIYDLAGGGNPGNIISNAVAQGRNGDLYMTNIGGDGNSFLLQVPTNGAVTPLYPVGGYAVSGATLGTDGNLYGTDQNEGAFGNGQVYKISPSGTFTDLYDFTGQGDGAYPNSAPIQASNGLFYGTCNHGGTNGESTAYSISSTGKFTALHSFDPNLEGSSLNYGLVQGVDGNFYGTSQYGGTYGNGTIFRMTPSGQVTVIHSFDNTNGVSDGNGPLGALVLGNDGNLYGTTVGGGINGAGIFFKLTDSGSFTILYNFVGAGGSGLVGPVVGLTLGSDDLFYGATGNGGQGTGSEGTLFSVSTSGAYKLLYTMCSQTNCTDGNGPASPVYQNTNGLFYGGTSVGGLVGCGSGGPGCGVIYSLNTSAKPFAALVNPAAKQGASAQILGQGFTSSSIVSFNGVPATQITATGKFISAVIPSGATTGFITVTTGSTTLKSSHIFRVLPTIVKFTPSSGPVGSSVTINGTGLTQTTRVTFNGKSASFTVVSDAQLTATVPTGATSGKITITTQGGATTSTQTFTVN